jgi:hypothetical protein
MQLLETKINKLEKCINKIEELNTKLKECEPNSEEFYKIVGEITNIIEIMEEYEESDSDSDSDTDSDVSFTEEERKHIENEEHYNFLKRYSIRP